MDVVARELQTFVSKHNDARAMRASTADCQPTQKVALLG